MPMPDNAGNLDEQDDPMAAEVCKPDPDLYVPSNTRVSRWEDLAKRDSRRKKGWRPAHEKTFTP
jgi:hypothetical protein